MNLEQAITTAIKYETKVHAIYLEAAANTSHEVARRIFASLCAEEKAHLRYLRRRLEEWRARGSINIEELGGTIGSRTAVETGVARLRATLEGTSPRESAAELDSLKKALDAERETSAFYRQMVETLDSEARLLFERFVEIEDGHLAIVQAEIDLVTGMGFWFDTADINPGSG